MRETREAKPASRRKIQVDNCLRSKEGGFFPLLKDFVFVFFLLLSKPLDFCFLFEFEEGVGE